MNDWQAFRSWCLVDRVRSSPCQRYPHGVQWWTAPGRRRLLLWAGRLLTMKARAPVWFDSSMR